MPYFPSTIGVDPVIDYSFAMCLIGIIVMIIAGLIIPSNREKLLNKIVLFGALTTAIGGIILMARIM
ncbi:MAG: hypothetical protein K0S93_189 [Nitrososphaeraceae archaeon]|jgi:hypothetical protein|nr:hypothetical protein [Nitrososphaeraceae archaeon]